MERGYDKVIGQASGLLAAAVLTLEKDLSRRPTELDWAVKQLLWRVGQALMTEVYSELCSRAVVRARERGLHVHRMRQIRVGTVFGEVTLDSPYMRNKATGESARPVFDELGFRDRSRTLGVERALADFGAEESFALAAKRFEEHYHHEVGRTSVLRLVEDTARDAQHYVEARLDQARGKYEEPIATRPGLPEMLIQLDGCEIRTGTLETAETDELTEVRELPKRRREEAWREVRVAFARSLHEVDRTYVAQMAKYPEVVGQLFSAAVDRGLSSDTEVVAVSDGGQGLKEELEAQFPGLFFILDHPHLCQHLHDTGKEMGLADEDRHAWVRESLKTIEPGGVETLLEQLQEYSGDGADRVRRLCGYLERFKACLDYDTARESDWPIGSGEIESAHRYIPQKRLKLPGACWRPETINPMLALRIVRANDWWTDFWDHQAQARRAA